MKYSLKIKGVEGGAGLSLVWRLLSRALRIKGLSDRVGVYIMYVYKKKSEFWMAL